MRKLLIVLTFFFPQWVAIASLGLAAYNTFANSGGGGGGSTGGAGPNMYVPTGLGAADVGWQQNQAANQAQLAYGGGAAQMVDPLLLQSLQQQQAINYAPYMQASQQAGQQYGNLAGMAGQYGGTEYQNALNAFGQEQALQNAGQQVFNLGLDPRNQAYQQQLNQTMNQANAINSMYGLGSSGAGAGMAQQAAQNFNTDWQNQQLARAAQGLGAYTGAARAAGQYGLAGSADLQAALGYYGQQPGFTQQAAQVPLNAQQYIAGMPAQNAQGYISGLSQAMTPYAQMQNQAIPYMNYGQGAGANAFSNTLRQQQLQGQAYQQLGQAIGNVNWGNVANTVGGWFGSGSTGSGDAGTGAWVDPTSGTTYNNPSAYTYTGP